MDARLMVVLLLLLLPSLCAEAGGSSLPDVNETAIVFGPLVIAGRMTSAMAGVGAGKTQVHIVNSLGGGKSLSIHCQSKDDDLQPQTVPDGGEFVWGFNSNIWGTTLFYCNLSPTVNFTFDAYDAPRDSARCNDCRWIVASEGMYACNQGTGLWEYAYSWSS